MITSAGQENDSFKNIVSQTHQQLKEFHVSTLVLGCECSVFVFWNRLIGGR